MTLRPVVTAAQAGRQGSRRNRLGHHAPELAYERREVVGDKMPEHVKIHIHVTFRPKIRPQHRTEQGPLTDVMPAAEVAHDGGRNW